MIEQNASLSNFEQKHIAKTFSWISDEEFRRLFLMRGEPDWNTHVEYFEKVLSDKGQKVYAIYFKGTHVGNCGYKNIDNSGSSELWIYIGDPNMRGKGAGAEVLSLLLKEGFKVMKFDLIYLHVADFNLPAIGLYKKFGFKEALSSSENSEWSNRGYNILHMELKSEEYFNSEV